VGQFYSAEAVAQVLRAELTAKATPMS